MQPAMPAVSVTPRIEWLTVNLILGSYGVWFWATTGLATLSLPLAMGVLVLALVLHSSLTHEVIHGHPTPWGALNAALLRPALGLCIPYGRFRDTHLAHHMDERLTDPYDDPETHYMDPAVWSRLSAPAQAVLRVNNTLLGRIVIGPLIGEALFALGDLRAIRAGDHRVRNSWLAHGAMLVPVVLWLATVSTMPIWAYLVSVYAALSIQKIRTYLEHHADLKPRARTAIVEDRGPLAFLFLNNNLHVVHHMHPSLPWYELPARYAAKRAHYLDRNNGYRFSSYAEVFRAYLLKAKDPVAHPLFHGGALATSGPSPSALGPNPLHPVDAVLHPFPTAPQPVTRAED